MKNSLHNKIFPIDVTIREFASVFDAAGFSLYVVGGAVRDWLLGIQNDDYDFTTDATPEEVINLFRKVIPTGIKHGTVTVLFRGSQYEVTTFRTDGEYHDHRHPDQVYFVRNLEEDLKRRDFTINALAANASTGEIIDMHNGIGDLRLRIVRAIGDPLERFSEDALRILRACRFVTKLNFTIEPQTYAAMQSLAPMLSHISGERIRDELLKILCSRNPLRGLQLMENRGILSIVLPELASGNGVGQRGFHEHDVLTHNLLACQSAAELDAPMVVRTAALLHDIGKPNVRKESEDGIYTFHRHELESERQAGRILGRLKFSNDERDQILNLIRNHMFHYTSDWSDGAVRRFVARVGTDAIENLFLLRLADQKAIAGTCDYETLRELSERIEKIRRDGDALSVKDLAIDGRNLMAIGVPPGPKMGVILGQLLETVMDDPKQNTKEQLELIASKLFEKLN
ncbi:MAG: HD domain-containing protein [Sphaerochaetaceae bacterium]|nr:HD domain-containing protein [Sphaerochaetaceae bacterium]